jgi:succinate dehydrogenase / fumarate reductase, cytochrome b subunit
MSWVKEFVGSSLGSKYVMALTGIFLFLFLIAHLAGNLFVFSGREALNSYAVGLRALPYGLLWVLRAGLAATFVVHIFTAINLSRQNSAARPHGYAKKKYVAASLASRTMVHSGMVVLAFLIFHLAHYTWRVVFFTGEKIDDLGRPDVYQMVVEGFSNPVVSVIYIISMLVLGFHLTHGLSSMFQSLGLNHSKYNYIFRKLVPKLGWAVAIGNIAIATSVWAGFLTNS